MSRLVQECFIFHLIAPGDWFWLELDKVNSGRSVVGSKEEIEPWYTGNASIIGWIDRWVHWQVVVLRAYV